MTFFFCVIFCEHKHSTVFFWLISQSIGLIILPFFGLCVIKTVIKSSLFEQAITDEENHFKRISTKFRIFCMSQFLLRFVYSLKLGISVNRNYVCLGSEYYGIKKTKLTEEQKKQSHIRNIFYFEDFSKNIAHIRYRWKKA